MRRIWGGPVLAMLAVLLRAGWARAQATDPVPVLPISVAGPPRTGAGRYGAEPYRAPEATTYGVLQEMASRAAVIFVGTVTSIRFSGGDDSGGNVASGFVAVEFRVEEGIAGPAAGTAYVMREWAGLWRDAARYHVGERRLMLLHAPGPWGLSSPVDGLDGAIPIAAATATVATEQTQMSAGGNAVAATLSRADLRWLQARQMRTVTFAADPVTSPGVSAASGLETLNGGVGAGMQPGTIDRLPAAAPSPSGIPSDGQETKAEAGLGTAPLAAMPLDAQTNPPLTEVIGVLRAGEASTRAAQ